MKRLLIMHSTNRKDLLKRQSKRCYTKNARSFINFIGSQENNLGVYVLYVYWQYGQSWAPQSQCNLSGCKWNGSGNLIDRFYLWNEGKICSCVVGRNSSSRAGCILDIYKARDTRYYLIMLTLLLHYN